MRRKETFQLHPFGFESSQEERFRLSLLDVVVPPNYNTYAIVFKNDDTDERAIVETFKYGIQATLQQCRHLVGKIQENEFGDYSIVKRPESTVEFVIQWLNEAGDEYPSYTDLERAHFTLSKLGSPTTLSVEGIPEFCYPADNPVVVGFQLNFIRGGFIFTVHIHHFALDMTGTTSLVRQIADNCYAFINNTPKPAWDESLMDRSRFICPDVAPEDQLDPMPRPERHHDWLPCSWLLFHLPPSQSKLLKQLASPLDTTWISTYDAVIALLWRVVARNRAEIYSPDLASPAIFGEPINMRSRCKCSKSMAGRVVLTSLFPRYTTNLDEISRQRVGGRVINAPGQPSHSSRSNFRSTFDSNSIIHSRSYW